MLASRMLKIPLQVWAVAPKQAFSSCLKPSTTRHVTPDTGLGSLATRQLRSYATKTRLGARREETLKSRTEAIRARAEAPTKGTAFGIGQGAVAGAAVMGLGALCYYGMGLSSEAGTIDRVALWPEYVKERVRSTYMYFGMGIASTAATAYAVASNEALLVRLMPKSWMGALGLMAVTMCSGMLCMAVPYSEGLGAKQLAWLGHSAVIGLMLAPMTMLGGSLVVRAAWYTAGIVGGLSCIAACAPSDKFLYMGGPLAMGLGVVFVSSLGSFFFSPMTALGSGLYAVSLYGGLILFSGFLLYDTQRIVRRAETHPQHGVVTFDPVNAAMSIYMDTINIFIRVLAVLSGGGGKRK